MLFEDQRVRKTVIITLGLLSLFLFTETLGVFQSYRFIGSSPNQQSMISVQGKGEVVGIPDLATFSFSVTEESLIVKEAQDEAAKSVNAVLDYLKKNGVAEKDVQTSGYNIYPRYEYGTDNSLYARYEYETQKPQGKQKLAAYVVSQSVTVKIRDLGNAGKLLGGIGELGATNVSGLSFDFDKRDELVRAARDKAIADARGEAAKLAQSLGVTLVRIVSYSEGGNYPVYYAKAAPMAAGGRESTAPEIPAGESKLTSNVTITYEIK